MGIEVGRHNPSGQHIGDMLETAMREGYTKGWKLLTVLNTFDEWLLVWETPDQEKREQTVEKR
jgi:hypothetical protein